MYLLHLDWCHISDPDNALQQECDYSKEPAFLQASLCKGFQSNITCNNLPDFIQTHRVFFPPIYSSHYINVDSLFKAVSAWYLILQPDPPPPHKRGGNQGNWIIVGIILNQAECYNFAVGASKS